MTTDDAPPDNAPLVTIGMPVYNGARHVEGAIASILAQTEGRYVLHVSDNCSTDGTPDICARLESRDPRLRFERQPANMGATRNFQRVLDVAQTPFFMWAAHDDLWEPNFLNECLRLLRQHPDAVGTAFATGLLNEQGETIGITLPPAGLASHDPVTRARVVRDQGHYAIYGLFRTERLKRAQRLANVRGGDVALIFGLALDYPFAVTNKVLWFYRGEIPPEQKPDPSTLGFVGPSSSRWRVMARYVAGSRLPLSQKAALWAHISWLWARDARRAILAQSPPRIERARTEGRHARTCVLILVHAMLRPRRVLAEVKTWRASR